MKEEMNGKKLDRLGMNQFVWALVLIVIFILSSCSKAENHSEEIQSHESEPQITGTLMVSAAASLTDALLEIKQAFEAEHDMEITFNFGGSGKLAQQIEQGAPVDVFISANTNWMDILVEHDFILSDSLTNVISNELVLIAHRDAPFAYDQLSAINTNEIAQFAIGHPESVPAGTYAKQALVASGLWNELEQKIVYTQDVRQVIAFVATGNADLGIVYASDALIAEEVKVLTTIDASLHDDIAYPAAIVTHAKNQPAAAAFLTFLTSAQAQEIFTRYGFQSN